jgi:hypothetical protein
MEFLLDFMFTRAKPIYLSAVWKIYESPNAEYNEELSEISALNSNVICIRKKLNYRNPTVASVLGKFLKRIKQNIRLINFSWAWLTKWKSYPPVTVRVKQNVLQAVSKAQLDALLCGLAGTWALSATSFYRAGIYCEFTEQYSGRSNSYQ